LNNNLRLNSLCAQTTITMLIHADTAVRHTNICLILVIHHIPGGF